MATVKLDTGALPKSNAGRKAIQPDETLVTALCEYFGNGVKDENGRPVFAGPTTDYDTQGKAQSAGRRHAKAVSEKLGLPIRVNINQMGEDGPYRWRLYVPASHTDKSGEAKNED